LFLRIHEQFNDLSQLLETLLKHVDIKDFLLVAELVVLSEVNFLLVLLPSEGFLREFFILRIAFQKDDGSLVKCIN